MYLIDVAGKRYQFELPFSCGIQPLNRDSSTRLTPWPRAVWDAVTAWSRQGERVDGDGVCLWGAEEVTDMK